MDKVKAIVLFASPWSIRDENTGIVREGITVEYVMTGNLEPVINEDGSMGCRCVKESIDINDAKQIVKVPGIYEMTYGYTVRRGKPVMKLKGMKFISEVKI